VEEVEDGGGMLSGRKRGRGLFNTQNVRVRCNNMNFSTIKLQFVFSILSLFNHITITSTSGLGISGPTVDDTHCPGRRCFGRF
jgi:hypothetical protein